MQACAVPAVARMAAGLAVCFALLPCIAWADDAGDVRQLLAAGDAAKALVRVEQALASNPRDARLRFLKGVALSNQGRSTEAVAVFQKLIEDYPELPEPYNNLGVQYAALGQYERARTALEMTLRLQPDNAAALENLGDVYAKLASQSYSRAVRIDSSNRALGIKLSTINEMLSPAPQRGRKTTKE